MMKYVWLLLFFLWPIVADAVEYPCQVEQKFDREHVYATADLHQWQFSVVIREAGREASLSRCGFTPSEHAVTCDTYDVDKIVFDKNVKIKKYYVFTGQFDVQLFPNLSFLENNGRGGIAYGTCRLASP